MQIHLQHILKCCINNDAVPKVHIPGFTFPVEDNFLEDALEWTKYDLNQNAQNGNVGEKIIEVVVVVDEIEDMVIDLYQRGLKRQ